MINKRCCDKQVRDVVINKRCSDKQVRIQEEEEQVAHRETALHFMSLNILRSHSRSFEMTPLSRACVIPISIPLTSKVDGGITGSRLRWSILT